MARLFDDGSNQYVSINSAVLTVSPFSMACWFNCDNVTLPHTLISIGDVDNDIDWCYLGLRGDLAGDAVAMVDNDSGPGTQEAYSTAAYTANTWYHAAGVVTNDSSRAAFINGGNKGTASTAITRLTYDTTSIGALKRGTVANYMSGSIAEAAIWNAVLTDAEVATLATGRSPLLVRPQSLVAYWPLIGNLSPEIDRVGGYDMTLYNAPTKAAHPRVIYPVSQQIFVPTAEVALYTSPFPAFRRV